MNHGVNVLAGMHPHKMNTRRGLESSGCWQLKGVWLAIVPFIRFIPILLIDSLNGVYKSFIDYRNKKKREPISLMTTYQGDYTMSVLLKIPGILTEVAIIIAITFLALFFTLLLLLTQSIDWVTSKIR